MVCAQEDTAPLCTLTHSNIYRSVVRESESAARTQRSSIADAARDLPGEGCNNSRGPVHSADELRGCLLIFTWIEH